MTGTARLNGFDPAAPVADADLVYMAQGTSGQQAEVAGSRGALAAFPYFGTFAALATAIAGGKITFPREVFVVADETKGGGPIKYFFDASGNRYWSAMVLDA
ncbi:hypothetical protein [Paraburkholderia sp. BL17N1]|uniref:hypothetical protein n=1 Tax=Paraburkholderia sp. BL17N1 TaxID=1938798 RepID=UPI000EADA902|nr:hypothetical protein [Paraburkholderia sp. BL17N1]RKR46333.1 hypothetical protein B0G82_4016 [Paraburkholderia sp. BL17N1]